MSTRAPEFGGLDEARPDLDDLMAVAWRDFIMFAFEGPETVAAFNADTGRRYRAQRFPLDSLIGAATGYDADEAEAFVEWVTVNWWGLDEAPEAYREHLAAKKAEASA